MADGPQLSAEGRVHKDMTAVVSLDRDAELMIRVREGDQASFGLLLDKYRGPVVYFVYRMVQNQAVAEELAQEVFLRVYKSRETYEPTAKFTTWLFRIATHLALNWLRDAGNRAPQESIDEETEGPRRELASTGPSVEQVLVNRARLNEIRQAIEALPAKQRAAVLMH